MVRFVAVHVCSEKFQFLNTLPHYDAQFDDSSLYVDVESLIKFVLDSDVKLPETTTSTGGPQKRKREGEEGVYKTETPSNIQKGSDKQTSTVTARPKKLQRSLSKTHNKTVAAIIKIQK